MSDPRRLLARLGATAGWAGYVYASAVLLLGFTLAFAADRYLSVANLALIFLTVVLVVAVRTRMSVAVYAALVCFVGYNFFFTEPRHNLAIANADDVLAVVLFLVVALVCGRLATRLASQVASLRAARAHATVLHELAQRLGAVTEASALCEVGVQALAQALDGQVALVVRAAADDWQVLAGTPPDFALHPAEVTALERSCTDSSAPVTRMPRSEPWVLPLDATVDTVRALVVRPRHAGVATLAERQALAVDMIQDLRQALERAQLAEALERARVEGETERLRAALLSSVSHDLRSPLASMIGAASTLAAYEAQLPDDERRSLMESILEEGERLDRYIQNLLDMTRLGHGELALHRDWVDAADIVWAAITRLRKFQPDTRIDSHMPQDTVLLFVHPALIEQALFNILENAAHVSPADRPILVTVEMHDQHLRIDVSDRGPGIPDDERQRIFDTFYSVSRGDRAPKGTGLGLSICRGLIGAHGGQVQALPRAGGGTTLRITLPLPATPPEASA